MLELTERAACHRVSACVDQIEISREIQFGSIDLIARYRVSVLAVRRKQIVSIVRGDDEQIVGVTYGGAGARARCRRACVITHGNGRFAVAVL